MVDKPGFVNRELRLPFYRVRIIRLTEEQRTYDKQADEAQYRQRKPVLLQENDKLIQGNTPLTGSGTVPEGRIPQQVFSSIPQLQERPSQ